MHEAMDTMEKFRAQWRRDWRNFLIAGCLSCLLALAAQALSSTPALRSSPEASLPGMRAWLYVVAGYFVLVPVSLVLQKARMQAISPRQGKLADRIFMLVLAVCIFLPVFFFPEAILVLGPEAAGRLHGIYRAMVSTVPGLAVTGTFLFYGAASAVWMLSTAFRHLGSSHQDRRDAAQGAASR